MVGVGRDDSSAFGEAFAFFGRLAVGVKAGELVAGDEEALVRALDETAARGTWVQGMKASMTT